MRLRFERSEAMAADHGPCLPVEIGTAGEVQLTYTDLRDPECRYDPIAFYDTDEGGWYVIRRTPPSAKEGPYSDVVVIP